VTTLTAHVGLVWLTATGHFKPEGELPRQHGSSAVAACRTMTLPPPEASQANPSVQLGSAAARKP
jgi:hypothetical protein